MKAYKKFLIIIAVMFAGIFLEPVQIYGAPDELLLDFYEDDVGTESMTTSKDAPLELIYGTTKTIYIDHKNETLFYEIFSTIHSSIIHIEKESTSSKEGYTSFIITPKVVGETQIVFMQSNEENLSYPKMYIKIHPKEIDIDTTNSFIMYSKIYDNNHKVFENPDSNDNVDIKNLILTGIEKKDQGFVAVDQSDLTKFHGTLPEEFPLDVTKDATTKISFDQSQILLTGECAINYVLKEKAVEIPAIITIKPRPVEIVVRDATRSFGHAYNGINGNIPDYKFESGDWLDVPIGTGDEIIGILEEDYIKLESSNALVEMQEGGNAAKPGVYENALSISQEQLNNRGNYSVTILKGTLTILEEKIPTNIEELSSYIELENNTECATMYFDESKKLWVKSEGGKLKLSAKKEKLYDTVWLSKINEHEVNVSLTEGYTFTDGTKSGEVKLSLQLKNAEGAMSQPFYYTVYLDNTTPEVTFHTVKETEKTKLETLAEKVMFGAFHKRYYTVQIDVAESNEDSSGLKEWTYMILPIQKDMTKDELLSYIDSLKENGDYKWQPMTTKESTIVTIERKKNEDKNFVANNYVILVKPVDRVTNSSIYTSLGIILDHNDPYIDLNLAREEIEKEVYDSDVKLSITVTDNHKLEDQTVSGVKEVYYQIALGKEKLNEAKKIQLYQAEKGKKYELNELQNQVLSKDIIVEKKWNSNNVWVRVTAIDHSGNEFYAFKQLKIDAVNPKVTVKYETNATEKYAPYYKEDRTAVITIKERNINLDNRNELWFELQKEGEETGTTYSLSSLRDVEGIVVDSVTDSEEGKDETSYTDERLIKINIRFHGDNKYKFDVHCVDTARRENKEENSAYFIIDQTMPKINVTYWNQDGAVEVSKRESKRFYSNTPMTAKIEMIEHNFAPDQEETWETDGDLHASVHTFYEDGTYRHTFYYTDLAGNTVSYGPGCFTVDQTKPTGNVEIKGFGFWERLLEKITFGLFSPSSVEVVVLGKDKTSPIKPVEFARVEKEMTGEDLEKFDKWSSASKEKPESIAFSVKQDEQFIVYAKVTDYAGNYQFISSDGMIVDCKKPAPAVSITNLSQEKNGIFRENVTLQIDVEDPTQGGTYSGLEKVWYTVLAAGNVTARDTITILDNSKNKVQGNKTFSKVITIPAEIYNSNDVKVQAFAKDFAGNLGESEVTQLKIDVTKPVILVSWDSNHPINGKYYKNARTATITIKERNFDPDNVKFHITSTSETSAIIGKWSSSSNIGILDTATTTCRVSFPEDGDYTFTLKSTDLAGNGIEYEQIEKFTIDQTVPVIIVSYDNNNEKNGKYFCKPRIATVTIREHNFNAADVHTAITASLEGREIDRPSIGGFIHDGDNHTAKITFGSDGDYTFDIAYTDMAGNAAAVYAKDRFTIDLTAPNLRIIDVEDQSANNGIVEPKIETTDTNFNEKGVTITLIGANKGKLDVDKVFRKIRNGQAVKFHDFERTEEMDDLYKLQAKAVDYAGNETKKEIVFSVNRYGSVFVLDKKTKDWLRTKDVGYTYIKEEKEIGIREINVDTIASRSITINRDGNLVNLKENRDYTVESSDIDIPWKEMHYILAKDNFQEEGNYTVILNTKDRANNSMNNTSVKKKNQNLPIEFAVDKTAPTIVLSGVEDGQMYDEEKRTMLIDAKDNLELASVSVSINGKTTTYKGRELTKNHGIIETEVLSANHWQKIKITAKDAAGNEMESPVRIRVLVTPNILIRYYMNKPLFYGSIVITITGLGMLIFMVMKKKKYPLHFL